MHAGTDVTGFGLLGHLHEMAEASGCSAVLDLAAVPLFERALDWAEGDVVPGRTAEIVAWAEASPDGRATPTRLWMKVLCDPQTSGGLLMAVAPIVSTPRARPPGAGRAGRDRGRSPRGEPGAVRRYAELRDRTRSYKLVIVARLSAMSYGGGDGQAHSRTCRSDRPRRRRPRPLADEEFPLLARSRAEDAAP